MQPPFRPSRSANNTPYAKTNLLFALALLLLLGGVITGWGMCNISSGSTLAYQVTHPDVVFTPDVAHSTPKKVDNSGDQISTNFDHETARLLIQPANNAPLNDSDNGSLPTPIPTPTIDPALSMQNPDVGAHLQIPAIKVDAPVEAVGLNMNNRMDVPSLHGANGVGWFINGPRLGGMGSAVIDGYASQPDGTPGVFGNLANLHKGDVILIVNQNGNVQHFSVLTVRSYPPDQTPATAIFGNGSGTYLNLITCDDNWIPTLSGAPQIVVHAISS
ncbi:class F sortase [Dictyobacter formicarum]|uniref:Class F sortase n=1 Tax=Dictyobacter formicarum TaxID=2778368 RepID=A0ABQ3VIH1_9CHLR|nr:class F sortase [Dictyobacter formicarum]GHO85618.1 hypothetical protein KSZ_36240 [Dictyobacter formicarum]